MQLFKVRHPSSDNLFCVCRRFNIKTQYQVEKNEDNSTCIVNRDYYIAMEDVELHSYQWFWEILTMFKSFEKSDSIFKTKHYKKQLTSWIKSCCH